jgi:hypothetical protein
MRRAAGLVAGALLLTACAPITSSRSQRLMVYEETPERIAIVYGLGAWKTGVKPADLHNLLAAELAKCKIATTPVFGHTPYKPPPGMDPNRIYDEEFKKISGFKAEAALFIYESEATHRVKTEEGATTLYAASFYDAKLQETVWQASIRLVSISSFRPDSEEKALVLVDEIMPRLVEDRVIRTCPRDTP